MGRERGDKKRKKRGKDALNQQALLRRLAVD